MQLDSLDSLFVDQLKDLYSAESQVLKFMPKMVKAASTEALKAAFEEHRKQTEGQLSRLDAIGTQLGMKLSGKRCKGMQGLIEEGKEALKMEGDEPFIDMAMVAAAQRVEHYEIAAYTSAHKLAEQLRRGEAANLLQESLNEESATDRTLSELAERELLQRLAEEEATADELAPSDEAEEEALDEEEEAGLVRTEVSDEELEAGAGEQVEEEEFIEAEEEKKDKKGRRSEEW